MGCNTSELEDDDSFGETDFKDDFADLPNVTDISGTSIEKYFAIEKELGRGGSCRVLKVKKKATNEFFAMKELLRDDEWNPTLFRQEIHILTALTHANVLHYREAYVHEKFLYICTTMCTGGELFDKVKKLRHFSEKLAADVLRVILIGIKHIHSKHTVHRDLKPENIVYDSPDGDLVLIDFGDAQEIERDSQIFSDFVGTPFYLAPECVRHRSGWELYKSDMWAVGVIAYVLLTGRPPFWGRNNREILIKITTGSVMWPAGVHLSRPCKNFVLSLLHKDPRKRLSAVEALDHPWIVKEANANDTHLGTEVLQNLANFASACKLKKLIVTKMVNNLTTEEKTVIAEAFKQLDYNGDGVIEHHELKKFLIGTGLDDEGAESRATELIQAMDRDGDGKVDLNEFTFGKTSDRLASEANLIDKQFANLDKDGDGQVSIEEIRNEFADLVTEEELDDIVKEIDKDGDGVVSLEEFKRAMRQVMETERTFAEA